jgi:hypothetical protein
VIQVSRIWKGKIKMTPVILTLAEKLLVLTQRVSNDGKNIAELMRTTPVTVSAWRTGKRLPSKIYRDRLIEISNGLIAADDFPAECVETETEAEPVNESPVPAPAKAPKKPGRPKKSSTALAPAPAVMVEFDL